MSNTAIKPRIPGRVWKTAMLGGMASWIDAGVMVASGMAFTFYLPSMGLNTWDLGVFAALITGGLAIGALIGGPLGDRYGRKKVFSVDLAILVIGLAFLTFAPSSLFLYIGVVITGLAMGADLPVSLALVAEETPEQFRGRMVAFSQILWGCGTVLVILLSNVITFTGMDQALGARLLFGHLMVIAAVTWILRQRLPESAEWRTSTATVAAADQAPTAPKRATGLRALKGYWTAVIALSLFYATGSIAASTGGQFSFFIITQVAGASPQVASLTLLGFIPVGFITGFLFIKFADTKYRIPAFIVGSVMTVAGMAVCASTGMSLVPYLIGLFGATFGSGLGGETIFKVWTQEKFPTISRATAQGVGIFLCRAAAAVAAVFTPALAATDPSALYWGLAGLNLISFFIGLLWVTRLKNVRMLRDNPAKGAEKQATTAAPAAPLAVN